MSLIRAALKRVNVSPCVGWC